MDPILVHVNTGEQPEDKIEARIIWLKTNHYVLYDDKLYRRGYSMPLLKCTTPSKAKYIMREIHEGTYRNYAGGQSLGFKALIQGCYWPTMKADCMEYARKYDKCQCFSPMSKAHSEELTSMTSPWPFDV